MKKQLRKFDGKKIEKTRMNSLKGGRGKSTFPPALPSLPEQANESASIPTLPELPELPGQSQA